MSRNEETKLTPSIGWASVRKRGATNATAKFIVTGEMTQVDLPKKNQSGLATAVRLLDNVEGIDIIHLSGSDVVRHKLVKRILEAYGDI